MIANLVGNSGDPMIGGVIQDEFSSARDWPMASAIVVALVILMVGPSVLYSTFQARAKGRGGDPK